MKISSNELKNKWYDFWKSKNHKIISSAGVIPDNDPTALFYNSGMHPLVPYLMGENHPQGTKLANIQKCIRTGDIDEVGDCTHLTFFEMLGNWSLGDYFKKEQIPWSFEFLTKALNIPLKKLAVSVFEGDHNAPSDLESAKIWEESGISKNKIAFLPASENWWAKGVTGPCGPDSEIFYWTGDVNKIPQNFQETWEDPRWVEIWNNVFMQFNKNEKGKLENLPNKNIDTGMGFERTLAVLNGKSSVFETDVFSEILEKISDLAKNPDIYKFPTKKTSIHNSARIIADHVRSATIILADLVSPSNTEQGYILRRLIRRAIRHGKQLNINQDLCSQITKIVIKNLSNFYPELKENQKFILDSLNKEELQFRKTLTKGENQFKKLITKCDGQIKGVDAFDLYQTYGFPIEMTIELAKENNLSVDKKDFENHFQKHQNLSRGNSAKKFQGGLSCEDLEKEKKLHTATHLLHAALKKFLGSNVEQKGSNINSQRLRFDFNYPEKVDPEILKKIEIFINEIIKKNIKITCEELSLDEAKKSNAIGIFGHKYGETVKVFTIGEYSKEICGGPHASSTGELGIFSIKKEQSSGQGVRRIKAVLKNL